MPTYNQQNANLSELFKAPDPLAQIKPILEMMQVMKQIETLNAEKEIETLNPEIARLMAGTLPGIEADYYDQFSGPKQAYKAFGIQKGGQRTQLDNLREMGIALNTLLKVRGLEKDAALDARLDEQLGLDNLLQGSAESMGAQERLMMNIMQTIQDMIAPQRPKAGKI